MSGVEVDPAALTAAHVAVENELVALRDDFLSVIGPANGFTIRTRDGQVDGIMRLGTRAGLEIAIKAYLEALADTQREVRR